MYSHTKYKLSGQQIYEIHFSDKYNFILNCRCTSVDDHISRPVRNIKWYPFEDNGRKYMYIKLEDSKTFSVAHAVDMYKRYGPGKTKQCIKSRREDCNKEKLTGEPCTYLKTQNPIEDNREPFNSPNMIKLPDIASPVQIKENYYRQGDEMFIPQELNTYLLGHIGYNLKFQHEDDTVNVSVLSGGKSIRKNKTRKSIRKNKTRKSINKSRKR